MENQESSANTEVPFDVTEITADDINTEGIEGMEGIINTSTQSRDIYGVQPKRNKALKLLALHILKHLPEDILREEPDFSSIKSNEAIQDYGPCMECDTPILTEDPPRSLMLNVCGDMIYRTCAKGTDKRGTLYCSCGKDDDSDPLLPPPDYDDADLFEEICDKCSEVISKVPLFYQESVLPYKRQLYCCHASIGCTSFVSIVSVSCVLNARQFMNWKKKGITFHLPFKKRLGKGRDKRANIDPPGVQRHKLSFVSCLSLHLMSYQLDHPPKL